MSDDAAQWAPQTDGGPPILPDPGSFWVMLAVLVVGSALFAWLGR